MFGQFHDIPLKCAGIGSPGIGKAKFDLADDTARSTKDSRDPKFEIDLLPPDRQGMEPSQDIPFTCDLNTFTAGASQTSCFLLDTEDECALLVFCFGVSIAVDAESMVQYARGHTSTSLFPLGKPPALPGDYNSLTVPEK
jgi:hypothetical protein